MNVAAASSAEISTPGLQRAIVLCFQGLHGGPASEAWIAMELENGDQSESGQGRSKDTQRLAALRDMAAQLNVGAG